ncbi:MAG: DNA mismatch repair endonuclease MutL, partial [Bdellovibrionota bacterium]
MSGPIQLLDSDVVDQIAAGEVVERPAHLVKELVENAIDAGATSIEIEYDQGGRRVRVTDDGNGIAKEQLALALARHATSKISKADDLWSLGSFGFRGEALASIAAVSRLTLQSRRSNDDIASKVVAEFGRLSEVEPVGGNPGTTVLIDELFANIPARLKFLKTEAGENAQIKNTLKAIAIAHRLVFRHYQHIPDQKNVQVVRAARLAPAVTGKWQCENDYLPCRA